ncbi:MAG: hypothetical protein QXQ79_00775 [Candidatus Nanoarchaeia archaeon]
MGKKYERKNRRIETNYKQNSSVQIIPTEAGYIVQGPFSTERYSRYFSNSSYQSSLITGNDITSKLEKILLEKA